jgi:mycoredoxin
MTRRALAYLQTRGVAYEYIDVEQDEAASEWVKRHNHGKEKKPTVDIAGQILSEPTDEELESALTQARRH